MNIIWLTLTTLERMEHPGPTPTQDTIHFMHIVTCWSSRRDIENSPASGLILERERCLLMAVAKGVAVSRGLKAKML